MIEEKMFLTRDNEGIADALNNRKVRPHQKVLAFLCLN